ncbi:hypothetical protein GW17_00035343 [Ensete ventricosum]|nr:hypothetical protein GW17_00035343 [Ensete ventricosum]
MKSTPPGLLPIEGSPPSYVAIAYPRTVHPSRKQSGQATTGRIFGLFSIGGSDSFGEAKRSKLEGSSDGGGRREQQQCRLRLRCDFVAAGGVDCSKGVAAIGGRQGSDVHSCCRGGQQWYGTRDYCCYFQFVVGCDQDSWQRTIVTGCDINRLQRKIAAGSFLPQGSPLATIKEDGSKRSRLVALGSERCMLRLKG